MQKVSNLQDFSTVEAGDGGVVLVRWQGSTIDYNCAVSVENDLKSVVGIYHVYVRLTDTYGASQRIAALRKWIRSRRGLTP